MPRRVIREYVDDGDEGRYAYRRRGPLFDPVAVILAVAIAVLLLWLILGGLS